MQKKHEEATQKTRQLRRTAEAAPIAAREVRRRKLSPFESWLGTRGMRTSSGFAAVAAWLPSRFGCFEGEVVRDCGTSVLLSDRQKEDEANGLLNGEDPMAEGEK
jgi:hypothetical protein